MGETPNIDTPVRAQAERLIALAQATGSRATASADYRLVFVERRDGTRETVRVAPPAH
ncbi:MAG: hypothetical protein AB7P07_11880 [Hyphomonadaceae bacterium]